MLIGIIGWGIGRTSLLSLLALYVSSAFLPGSKLADYSIPWILEIARFLAPIIAAAVVLKLLISLIWKTTRDLKLRGIENHIVIWGLNTETNYLLENLVKQQQQNRPNH